MNAIDTNVSGHLHFLRADELRLELRFAILKK